MSTTLPSREFDHAKEAAAGGPVFITDHGVPTHVLLSIEEYRRLTGGSMSLLEAVAMPPGTGDFEFDPPRSRDLGRAAEFD